MQTTPAHSVPPHLSPWGIYPGTVMCAVVYIMKWAPATLMSGEQGLFGGTAAQDTHRNRSLAIHGATRSELFNGQRSWSAYTASSFQDAFKVKLHPASWIPLYFRVGAAVSHLFCSREKLKVQHGSSVVLFSCLSLRLVWIAEKY